MNKTILDLINEIEQKREYTKSDLIQILNEGYADSDAYEDAILNMYNATEDTHYVMIQGTTQVVNINKE